MRGRMEDWWQICEMFTSMTELRDVSQKMPLREEDGWQQRWSKKALQRWSKKALCFEVHEGLEKILFLINWIVMTETYRIVSIVMLIGRTKAVVSIALKIREIVFWWDGLATFRQKKTSRLGYEFWKASLKALHCWYRSFSLNRLEIRELYTFRTSCYCEGISPLKMDVGECYLEAFQYYIV